MVQREKWMVVAKQQASDGAVRVESCIWNDAHMSLRYDTLLSWSEINNTRKNIIQHHFCIGGWLQPWILNTFVFLQLKELLCLAGLQMLKWFSKVKCELCHGDGSKNIVHLKKYHWWFVRLVKAQLSDGKEFIYKEAVSTFLHQMVGKW